VGFRGISCQPLGENQNLLYEGTNIGSSPASSPLGGLVETGSHLESGKKCKWLVVKGLGLNSIELYTTGIMSNSFD